MEVLLLCLCASAMLFLAYGYALNHVLKTEEYEVFSEKVESDTVLVLLTDLHACEHGAGNGRLIERIHGISPAFICMAGDMTMKDGRGTERVLCLLRELARRYPVFYAPGNHEIRMPGHDDYRRSLKEAGVHYLEDQMARTEGNICVAGLALGEYWYHKCWQKRSCQPEVIREHLGSCDGQDFVILLAHNPEYFPSYADWGADLTLSGHIHGGILRLPLLGGMLSPTLRLFPTYDAGHFKKMGRDMVVSRGLGLHHVKFRFFNVPEISVVRIKNARITEQNKIK